MSLTEREKSALDHWITTEPRELIDGPSPSCYCNHDISEHYYDEDKGCYMECWAGNELSGFCACKEYGERDYGDDE